MREETTEKLVVKLYCVNHSVEVIYGEKRNEKNNTVPMVR
jgi:hypothetical protein